MVRLKNERVLVVGASGMLAGHLLPLLKESSCHLLLCDLQPGGWEEEQIYALDITSRKDVFALFADFRPTWIINCAAYTAVDRAENEKELAFLVNASGPGNLALASRDYGGRVLHVSSDYIFGGALSKRITSKPLLEDDPPAPCGIYGMSKFYGDELILAATTDPLIVRTSWLHGLKEPNFVATMLRVSKERHELRVVDDQIGSPTWAGWLAKVILELICAKASGVFNASSHGGISWYDFACEIMHQAGRSTVILRQTSAELARPAPRPAYSTLNISKLENFLGRPCPSWQEGLREHLEMLGEYRI